jgi:glycosyltransferase involved in cell wall biosynthesis
MSGPSPSVSVVIPCYAQAHFLADAIESVLRQTHPPLEIIVIDDGSPDNVREVAGRYPEVRCISQPNQGLSAARNRGLREGSGDFIVFLDADDRLLPHALATGLSAFASRPACALVWGFHLGIDVAGKPVDDFRNCPHATGRARYVDLLRENVIGPPVVVMFRRALIDQLGGFLVEQHRSEDYEMYLRCVRSHEGWGHGQVVAEYRLHTANMSLDHTGMLAGTLMALDRQEPFVANDPGLRRVLRAGRRLARERENGGSLQLALSRSFRSGQWGKAIRGAAVLTFKYPRTFLPVLFRWMGRAFTGRTGRPPERRVAPE